MKFLSLIVLLLVVKTKASYFDAFRGVENAFGNLLNDVVSDLKSTVHCTILAMEEVLAKSGVISEPLSNKECYKEDKNINFDINTQKSNRNSYSAKDAAREMHSSIFKVNETLSHILDNTGHKRIEHLKREFKDESDRLTEVSSLFRNELDKISHRMKKEFQNVDPESDKTSLDSVWNNMKILYEVEKNDKNTSKEIGQVLDEALDILHLNKISEVNSDEKKINMIIRELEQESSNNNNSINTVHRELSESKGEQSALQNNLQYKQLSMSASKAVNDFINSDKVLKNVADYITDRSSSLVTSQINSVSTHVINDVNSLNTNLDGSSSPNLGTTNIKDGIEGIDEAMSIFNEAAGTQALLDNFFANEHGTNAFENPNLLDNFGK